MAGDIDDRLEGMMDGLMGRSVNERVGELVDVWTNE